MYKKFFTAGCAALAVVLSSTCIADEYKPTKIMGRGYRSTLYQNQSELFVAVPDRNKIVVEGFKGARKTFSIPVLNSNFADLCAANTKGQVVIRRGTAAGTCFLSLVDTKAKTVTDLVEEHEPNCFCNGTAINDAGDVAEAAVGENPDFSAPNPITIRSVRGGVVSSVDVPAQYLEPYNIDRIYDITLSPAGELVLGGISSAVSYNLNTLQYAGIAYDDLIKALGVTSEVGGWTFHVLRGDTSGVLFHATLSVDNYTREIEQLFHYSFSNGTVRKHRADAAAVWDADPSVRILRHGTDQEYNVLGCSVKDKRVTETIGFPYAITRRGDVYATKYFLKLKKTDTAMPFCYTASFEAEGSCKEFFKPTSDFDTRYGLDGDLMTFPVKDPLQQFHDCTFKATLTKADGTPLSNTSVLFSSNGSKASLTSDKNGVVRFRTRVDTANDCGGPSLEGPNGRKDVHHLTKYAWAQHCI